MRSKYFVRKTNHEQNLSLRGKKLVNEFKVKLKPTYCSFQNNRTRMEFEQQDMLPSKSNWFCISSKDLGPKMLPVSPPLGLLSHIGFCTPPTSAPQITLTCKVTKNVKMRMRQPLPAGSIQPSTRGFPMESNSYRPAPDAFSP